MGGTVKKKRGMDWRGWKRRGQGRDARRRREGCRSETRDGNGRSRDRVTDGSLQGGDATDDGGGGSAVGVVVVVLDVDVDVVVGLGRRGQMSRWIWHRPEMGGGGERGQRSVRRRLIWNGRGRVEFELSNDERGPTSVRFGWSRRSSTAKTGGLGLPEHCAGRAIRRRGSTVWMGPAGDWVLEGWRFADSPVSLRGSRVGGRESLWRWWVVRAKALEGREASAGIAGGSVVLWGFH